MSKDARRAEIDQLEAQFCRLDAEERSERWRQKMVSFLRVASRARRDDLLRAALMCIAPYEERTRRYKLALNRWRKIIDTRPEEWLAMYHVARLHYRLGHEHESKGLLHRIASDESAPHEIRRWAKRDVAAMEGAVNDGPVGSGEHDTETYLAGDHGVLGCILSEAARLAKKDPVLAEGRVRRLRRRAAAVGDDFAIQMCDSALATWIVRSPRRRVELLRRMLRAQVVVPHPSRRKANLLAELAIAERELGWTKASRRHRDEALALARGDPSCGGVRHSLRDEW